MHCGHTKQKWLLWSYVACRKAKKMVEWNLLHHWECLWWWFIQSCHLLNYLSANFNELPYSASLRSVIISRVKIGLELTNYEYNDSWEERVHARIAFLFLNKQAHVKMKGLGFCLIFYLAKNRNIMKSHSTHHVQEKL